MEKQLIKKTAHRAFLIASAAHLKDMKTTGKPEFAVLGRSNAGKSSFINHIFSDRTLARVSKTPGKTSLANIYEVDSRFYFVDLPGYGYAKAPGKEKLRWSRLISDYCTKRHSLKGIIWILDIRHPGLESDNEAHAWFSSIGLPLFPVLTKSDKLTKNICLKQVHEFRSRYKFTEDPVVFTITEQSSKDLFWERFERWRGLLGRQV